MQDQLRERAAYDVDPELSPAAQYMRSSMGVAGYKHLLAVGACMHAMFAQCAHKSLAPRIKAKRSFHITGIFSVSPAKSGYSLLCVVQFRAACKWGLPGMLHAWHMPSRK